MSESRNVSNLMIGHCAGWMAVPPGSPQGTSIGVLTLHHFVQDCLWSLRTRGGDTWHVVT
jgi:hypothetical protein